MKHKGDDSGMYSEPISRPRRGKKYGPHKSRLVLNIRSAKRRDDGRMPECCAIGCKDDAQFFADISQIHRYKHMHEGQLSKVSEKIEQGNYCYTHLSEIPSSDACKFLD